MTKTTAEKLSLSMVPLTWLGALMFCWSPPGRAHFARSSSLKWKLYRPINPVSLTFPNDAVLGINFGQLWPGPTPKTDKDPKLRHVHQRATQYFNFSERTIMNRVRRAILWVYIRGRDTPGVVGHNLTITVYKILHIGARGAGGMNESPVITPVISSLVETLPPGAGAWISIGYPQIERMVHDWFRNPENNLGIIINATDSAGNNLAVTSHSDTANVPFLEVYVTDIKKHRTKRTNGLSCNDSSNETRCCKYPLTVDFEEFGWDWIIAPKKYEANYCSGECPYVFMTHYPHTHIIHMANPSRGGPCCAPRKFSSISMLYFDTNMNIIYGHLPAMVVDRCGCL